MIVRRRKSFVFGIDEFGIDEIAIDSEIGEKLFLELWDVIKNDEGNNQRNQKSQQLLLWMNEGKSVIFQRQKCLFL